MKKGRKENCILDCGCLTDIVWAIKSNGFHSNRIHIYKYFFLMNFLSFYLFVIFPFKFMPSIPLAMYICHCGTNF